VANSEAVVKLDLSDVEHRLGKRVGGGQLWEPCNKTDIRRWVMAMDYVNPLHWDQRFARETQFGDIIAPQSMAVALDYGHGNNQACVGRIPGQHMIFGGEEWWWYGTHVRPGDQLIQERIFTGYKVSETKFAGPTLFQRGDTIHRNQRGDLIAKSCPTVIRYLAKEAEKRGVYAATAGAPKRWTAAEVDEINKIRRDWFMSNRAGKSPNWKDVQVGDRLPRRVIGPHSIASFTTEYRAFIFKHLGQLLLDGARRRRGSLGQPGYGLDRRLQLRRGRRDDRPAVCATASMSAPHAATSMTAGPAKSECTARMAMARPWRRGTPTISLLGRPRRLGPAREIGLPRTGL